MVQPVFALDDIDAQFVARKRQELRQQRLREMQQLQREEEAGTAPGETAAVTEPAREDEPAMGQEVTPSGGFIRRVGRDALQVLGGARDAFVETMQTLNLVGNQLREMGLGPQGTIKVRVPEVPESGTGEGALIRNASQFLTAFIPVMKGVRAVGVTGTIMRPAVAGAIADFAAFDPHDERMSNIINDLAPALRNPVTAYLEADPIDTDAEGRFKNALEGLGLGVTADTFFQSIKAIRAARRVRRTVLDEGGELAEQALRQAEEAAQLPVRDQRPLVSIQELDIERANRFIREAATGEADLLARSGKTVHVNFDRVNSPDDVKRVIAHAKFPSAHTRTRLL